MDELELLSERSKTKGGTLDGIRISQTGQERVLLMGMVRGKNILTCR